MLASGGPKPTRHEIGSEDDGTSQAFAYDQLRYMSFLQLFHLFVGVVSQTRLLDLGGAAEAEQWLPSQAGLAAGFRRGSGDVLQPRLGGSGSRSGESAMKDGENAGAATR